MVIRCAKGSDEPSHKRRTSTIGSINSDKHNFLTYNCGYFVSLQPHWRDSVVSFSKTLYPLLSTGLTQVESVLSTVSTQVESVQNSFNMTEKLLTGT